MIDQASESVDFSPEVFVHVDSEHPWPGLVSFREVDQEFFQGRGQEAEELARLVERQLLTVVYGISGLGKTSLLQAGLFPRIRTRGAFPVYVRLRHSSKAEPLTQQVLETIAREAEERGFEAPAPQAGETLWEYFHRADNEFWNDRNRPIVPVLVFDQFEEVFTLGEMDPARRARTREFLDQLGDLVEGRPPPELKQRIHVAPELAREFAFTRHEYKVMLVLREDYLPHLEGLRDRMRSIVHNHMRLKRMHGSAALEVAKQAPHLMDADVAHDVVRFVAAVDDDTSDDDRPMDELVVEPALLSVVCRELNETRISRGEARITAKLLEGSREQILEGLYERSVSDLDPAVRTFIEECLLTVSGFRDSVALENAEQTPGVTQEAIDLLINRRLLRVDGRAGQRRIELSHDLLTGVIRRSRENRRQLESIAAREQERADRDERERLARQERELINAKRIMALILLMMVVAVGGAIYGMVGRRQAKQQAEKTEKARLEADEARKEAQRSLAELELLRGVRDRREGKDSGLHDFLGAFLGAPEGGLGGELRTMALAQLAAWSSSWRHVFWHEAPVTHLAFTEAGTKLLTVTPFDVNLWSVVDGTRFEGSDLHANSFLGDIFKESADFDNAYVGPPDDEALVHSLFRERLAPGNSIGCISGYEDGRVVLWSFDPGGWSELETLNIGAPVVTLARSGDGQRFLAAVEGGEVRVWGRLDPDNGERIQLLERLKKTVLGRSGVHWNVLAKLRHSNTVRAAVFSGDGDLVATGGDDNLARIWEVESGKELRTPLMHGGPVVALAFNHDGSMLATGSRDRSARLWPIPVRPARPSDAPVGSTRRLLSASGDALLTLPPVEAHALEGQASSSPLAPHPTAVPAPPVGDGLVLAAAISDGGRTVVAATSESPGEGTGGNRAVVWTRGPADGEWTQSTAIVHAGLPGRVLEACISSDGSRLATVMETGPPQLWTRGGSGDWSLRTDLGIDRLRIESINVMRFGDADECLFVATTEGELFLLPLTADGRTSQPQSYLTGAPISAADSARGGKTWALGHLGGLKILKAGANATIVNVACPLPGQVRDVSVNADGTRVAISNGSRRVAVVDEEEGNWEQLANPLTHDEAVARCVLSGDGEHVLTVDQKDLLTIWSLNEVDAADSDGPEQSWGKSWSHQVTGRVQDAELSLDEGSLRVVVATPRSIRYWTVDPSKQESKGALLGNGEVPTEQDADWSKLSDGARHAFIVQDQSYGNQVRIVALRPDDEKLERSEPWASRAQDTEIGAIAVAPDGSLFVTAGSDGSCRLWRPGEKAEVGDSAHPSPISSVAFDCGSSRAWVTGTVAGGVRVFDDKPLLVNKLDDHLGTVLAVALRNDVVLSGSMAGTAILSTRADPSADFTTLTSLPHDSPVTAVAIGPGGKLLATGEFNGDVNLWMHSAELGIVLPLGEPWPGRVAVENLAFGATGLAVHVGDRDGNWTVLPIPDLATTDERLLEEFVAYRSMLSIEERSPLSPNHWNEKRAEIARRLYEGSVTARERANGSLELVRSDFERRVLGALVSSVRWSLDRVQASGARTRVTEGTLLDAPQIVRDLPAGDYEFEFVAVTDAFGPGAPTTRPLRIEGGSRTIKPIDLTQAFNADVVHPLSPGNIGVDNWYNCLIVADDLRRVDPSSEALGLPRSRRHQWFELGPYDGENCIQLIESETCVASRHASSEEQRATSALVELPEATAFERLHFLVVSGDGDSEVKVTFTYADGSTSEGFLHADDWYDDDEQVSAGARHVLDGMDRWWAGRTEGVSDPSLFQVTIDDTSGLVTTRELAAFALSPVPGSFGNGGLARFNLLAVTGVAADLEAPR